MHTDTTKVMHAKTDVYNSEQKGDMLVWNNARLRNTMWFLSDDVY